MVICGENNLLKNPRSAGTGAAFRDPKQAERFGRVRTQTDIFLNPAHKPGGRIGLLKRTWKSLSGQRKLCLLSVNALQEGQLGQRRFQYAFGDGEELLPVEQPVISTRLRLARYEWGD